MRTRILFLTCSSLAALGMTTAAGAQGRSFASCWLRPAPAPTCGSYIVTEAAVEIPLVSSSHQISAGSTEKDFDTRFILSAGFMKNLPSGKAVGIIAGHDVNRSINRIPTRVEGRLRQWTGSGKAAFDLSAGLSRKGIQSMGDVNGFTAAIGGEWRYIGADARLDLHDAGGRTVYGGFIGARATSIGAPIAALLTFGAVAALIISSGAGY